MTSPELAAEACRDQTGRMTARMSVIGQAATWTEAGEQARAEWDAPYGPAEQWDLRVKDRQAPGPHGPVPGRIYTPTAPAGAPRAVGVWCHGRGLVPGEPDQPGGDQGGPGGARRRAA